MTILFLHSLVIAPDKGGIERVTRTLTDGFLERGHTVYFLAAKPTWKEFADKERQFFLPNAKEFAAPENAGYFERFLREHAVDVVIFQWADGKRFPFGEICRKLRVSVISAIHTDPCFYERRVRGSGMVKAIKRWWRFRRQAKIYRENAACSVTTVLLSERFIPGFLKHFPRTKKPSVCAMPNPSSYENVSVDFAAKKKELLFVGRMEKRVKQPHLLLLAWKKIQARFPDWSLVMVGGGHEEAEIRAYAETLGLERVRFEGFQNPERFYRDASVFCMASAYEGFPMVLVEAASHACAPVAFDSFFAVRDIISDGENGCLVPAFDTEQYATVLCRLMADEALRNGIARAAYRDVARFSLSKLLDRWTEILKEARAIPE